MEQKKISFPNNTIYGNFVKKIIGEKISSGNNFVYVGHLIFENKLFPTISFTLVYQAPDSDGYTKLNLFTSQGENSLVISSENNFTIQGHAHSVLGGIFNFYQAKLLIEQIVMTCINNKFSKHIVKFEPSIS